MDLRQVPKDELLLTALLTYKTSDTTNKLKSERFRTVLADDFKTEETPLLTTMCLKTIAQHYKGRPINLTLSPVQARIFYDYIDPHLPIGECINIEDEYYWKRVYCLICHDKVAIKKKIMDRHTYWKELVINMKYVEVVENTPVEIWRLDEMHKLSKLVSLFIKTMTINKLQPMRESSFRNAHMVTFEASEELEEVYGDEKAPSEEKSIPEEDRGDIDIFPVELCHHVDLSIVQNLTNMHKLIIEFLPPELGMHYNTRFLNFSYVDMQNLASGISELPNLKSLIIRRSRLDCIKLSTILEAAKTIFLEHLEFFFCQLNDDCGECLYEYLISTSTLKNLNLSGNQFRDSGIEYLAEGIENSPAKLTHLNISNNPITDKATCKLMDTLKGCKQLEHLALSGIKVTKPGSICIAKLVKINHNLEEVDVTATPMEGFYLIDSIDANENIQQLLCQGCGLTVEEEFKVELLLKRNRYIRENPYIGDLTKSEEEIISFVSRIKNPILLEALDRKQSRKDCHEKVKKQTEGMNKFREQQMAVDSDEINYEADKFTRAELSNRITLFAQTNFNFFRN